MSEIKVEWTYRGKSSGGDYYEAGMDGVSLAVNQMSGMDTCWEWTVHPDHEDITRGTVLADCDEPCGDGWSDESRAEMERALAEAQRRCIAVCRTLYPSEGGDTCPAGFRSPAQGSTLGVVELPKGLYTIRLDSVAVTEALPRKDLMRVILHLAGALRKASQHERDPNEEWAAIQRFMADSEEDYTMERYPRELLVEEVRTLRSDVAELRRAPA